MKIKVFQGKFTRGTGSPGGQWGILAFLLIVSLTIFVLPANSGAKDWPTKPITLIVPWSVGGSTDLVGRILAPKISKILDVSIHVVCKPGAGGITGALEVVKSPPDGYTILLDSNSSSSIQFALGQNLPYKVEERTYIARATYNPMTLVVPASSPWKNVKDLVNAIRANPSSINFGMISGMAASDINVMQFLVALKTKGMDISEVQIVKFKGSGEVVRNVAGGHVKASFSGIPTSSSLVNAGKLRPLGVTGPKRFEGWPNVPTMVEEGFPEIEGVYWIGLSGPPGLPTDIAKIIDNALKEALRDPDLIEKVNRLGAVIDYKPFEVQRKLVLAEVEAMKSLKHELGELK